MNRATFLDTGYILAALNTRDKFHTQAQRAAATITPPFLTTEAVLIEIGNTLAKIAWRATGIAALQQLRGTAHTEIVPVDSDLLARAIALYTSRPDKEWGLTDCISFVVMQERSLTDVLTTDHHFAQAGFHNLLAEL